MFVTIFFFFFETLIVLVYPRMSTIVFFLIKQLVVNSKNIGGSAAGQTKRIEKDRSALVSF